MFKFTALLLLATPFVANAATRAIATPASSAFEQVVQRKLEAAEATQALAADPCTQRVPLTDYLVLLQRDTCAGAFGDLTRGRGAECMSATVATEASDATEDEDVQVCASHGGVLVARMQACSDASAALALAYKDHDQQAELDAMMRAYTDVARLCWGRTLCVE